MNNAIGMTWRCSMVLLWLTPAVIAAPPKERELSGRFVAMGTSGHGHVLLQTESGGVSAVLQGVAVPEPTQPGYRECQELIAKLIGEDAVTATLTQGKDPPTMRLNIDKLSINRELIRLGGAWHDPRAVVSPALVAAEREARENRRGIWSADIEPIPPWKEREKRIAEFRKSLEVPAELREPALATLNRAIEKMGGEEATRQLMRVEAEFEVKPWSLSFFGGGPIPEDATLQCHWEVPDRARVVYWPTTEDDKRWMGYGASWNRPVSVLQMILSNRRTELPARGTRPAKRPDPDSGDRVESAHLLFEIGDVENKSDWVTTAHIFFAFSEFFVDPLAVSPFADEKRYAMRLSKTKDGAVVEHAVEVFPLILIERFAEQKLDDLSTLPWLRIHFDSKTNHVARFELDGSPDCIVASSPKTYDGLTLCSQWSMQDKAGAEKFGLTIKRLEFPDKIAPEVFTGPVRRLEAPRRIWTSENLTFEATFLKQEDGKVWLRKVDGTDVAIPRAKLSNADQDFVRKEIAKARLRWTPKRGR